MTVRRSLSFFILRLPESLAMDDNRKKETQMCWNCKTEKQPVKSPVTENKYCVECGAVVNKIGMKA